MPRSTRLRVMISSRCEALFPAEGGRKLSAIRLELKDAIEAMEVGGHRLFDVWINETTPPQGGTWDSWDVCLQAVKECDILLIISNGDAGWARSSGEIGICHAELMTGLAHAPAKIRLIALPNVSITEDEAGHRNGRFQDELKRLNIFRGGTVSDQETLMLRVKEALHDAVIALAQAGVADSARGKYHSGAALDWSRLDFQARHDRMIDVVRDALRSRDGSTITDGHVVLKLSGSNVLTQTHAVPAALTVGPAREMVGQPFLRDHLLAEVLKQSIGGPMHIIACQKTATESQAVKLLGFPDATIVSAPFGIFVADPVQKVQFAFITNCRDEAGTRHGVQRFFEWLEQTSEDANVAQRALARARILQAVAAEQGEGPSRGFATVSSRSSRSAAVRRIK